MNVEVKKQWKNWTHAWPFPLRHTPGMAKSLIKWASILSLIWCRMNVIKKYGSGEEKKGGSRWEVEQMGKGLANEQKARLMITWDLEMGMKSPHLPIRSISIPPLTSPLILQSCAYFPSFLPLTHSFSTLLQPVLVVFHVEFMAGND